MSYDDFQTTSIPTGRYLTLHKLHFCRRLLSEYQQIVSGVISSHSNFSLFDSRRTDYRPHYWTETAVTAVHDVIIKAIDAGIVCAVVLLDLGAAFDTVHHQILLQIMNMCFDVAGRALDWC